jgi:CxxH/CxxC protein (TIGR04129 family)
MYQTFYFSFLDFCLYFIFRPSVYKGFKYYNLFLRRVLTLFICCDEHLEIAIDQFVDDYEDAPDIYQLADVHFTDWVAPVHCQFCQEESKYIVL